MCNQWILLAFSSNEDKTLITGSWAYQLTLVEHHETKTNFKITGRECSQASAPIQT